MLSVSPQRRAAVSEVIPASLWGHSSQTMQPVRQIIINLDASVGVFLELRDLIGCLFFVLIYSMQMIIINDILPNQSARLQQSETLVLDQHEIRPSSDQ